MNKFASLILLHSCLCLSPAVFSDEGDWIVSFASANDAADARANALLQQEGGIQDIVALLESLIRLKHPVKLEVGALEGPHYEPATETVTIPYHFAQDIEQRFLSHVDGDSTDDHDVGEVVLDVVMHTLFHELGHVLMSQYEFPLFFEEEDVVDALANLLLLEYTEYGTEVAISAAEMYRLEATDIDQYESADFWGEHSLDLQRYYDVYCSIYGAYPEANAQLIADVFEGDGDHAEGCIDTYERVLAAWAPLLKNIVLH